MVKLIHNQDRVWIYYEQEHLSCYFLPPQHQFAPQEHPTATVKVQNKLLV